MTMNMIVPTPWIHPTFGKDGRLRVRERYWHVSPLPSFPGSFSEQQLSGLWILPDAGVWRTYLPLLQALIMMAPTCVTTTHRSTQLADPQHHLWFLLESVVEYMDHRNQSPSLGVVMKNIQGRSDDDGDGGAELLMVGDTDAPPFDAATAATDPPGRLWVREMAAPQERALLQQLIQKHRVVIPWSDLSIRTLKDSDEWESMHLADMPIEDRSRHALMRAARILLQQPRGNLWSSPSGLRPHIWILTEDTQLSGLVPDQPERVSVLSMRECLQRWFGPREAETSDTMAALCWDLWSRCQQEYQQRQLRVLAPRTASTAVLHRTVWSDEDLQEGLRQGTLLRGRFQVSKENPQEAVVKASDPQHLQHGGGVINYYINQAKGHFQQALHYDIVLIQPLPESEWSRPVGKRRLMYQPSSTSSAAGTDDTTDSTSLRDHDDEEDAVPPVPSARVVAIQQAVRRVYVATLVDVPTTDHHESSVLVVPMDIRIPKIRLRTRAWSNWLNCRLKVEIDGWEEGSHYPHGHCREVIGPVGDLETEVAALLFENQVELDPFSIAALACLPPEGHAWTLPQGEIQSRRDLRTTRRVFSVDPPGCQDIDDTMHVEVLPTGDIEVGVSIADVTYFVKHNSPLDKEAQKRGTTFYLVDRRFDMLPALLSSDLCSLHGGVDRLAVSVIWTMSPDFAKIKSCWYGRTVIHNVAAMTYDQADNILHGKAPDDPKSEKPPPLTAGAPVNPVLLPQLKKDLTLLTKLARKLRRDRQEIGGAVDLSSADIGNELKFVLDSGKPVKVVSKQDKEIHHTIEELMIMANTSVATKIFESFPGSALLRIHRAVQDERFEDLREVMEASGYSFDGTSNMALAKTLKEAQNRVVSNRIVQALFRSLATRAMSEAQYISSGSEHDESVFTHYGLGLDKYTHFTSPIRRYADVIVHKQLLAALIRSETFSSLKQQKGQQTEVITIPNSSAVSILNGEGLASSIDSITDKTGGLSLESEKNMPICVAENTISVLAAPYQGAEVASICEVLNLHNRLAKQSSFECQSLFLSLYFKENIEVAEVVVTSLRTNGFWCYAPKFDFKAPVYVRDIDGVVQVDPDLVGLPATSGLPATKGFASSSKCRQFPGGVSELVSNPEEFLRIRVPGASKTLNIRPLDVVNVEITCENWENRARVPSPRLQLIAPKNSIYPGGGQASCPEKRDLRLSSKKPSRAVVSFPEQIQQTRSTSDSLFDTLTKLNALFPTDYTLKSQSKSAGVPGSPARSESIRGRFVYGNFINPDTRSAQQEAAQRAASEEAAQRRANLSESAYRHKECDNSRKVERIATSRQQRLAAEKRNDRRSKAAK